MEILEIIGLFLAFGLILMIDMPKLRASDNKHKYTAVYSSILAIFLLLGILEVFNLIPDYNVALIDLYKKLTGGQ